MIKSDQINKFLFETWGSLKWLFLIIINDISAPEMVNWLSIFGKPQHHLPFPVHSLVQVQTCSAPVQRINQRPNLNPTTHRTMLN
jgi:hypothetical protein